jgi:hypothetical protein
MYSVKRSKASVLLAVVCLLGLLILPGIAYAQDIEPEGDGQPGEGSEFGDAPTSWNGHGVPMTAYPAGGPPGVLANFPVVGFPPGPPSPDGYGMCHMGGEAPSFMGPGAMPSKSFEFEADFGFDIDGPNNIWPPTDTPDQDGHDDGVTFPAILPHCTPVEIFVEGIIPPRAEYYIQVWADWNRDGDWNDGGVCGCGDDEYVQRDWAVIGDAVNGYFSTSIPMVPCHPVDITDPVWVRVTLSDEQFTALGPAWWASGRPSPEVPCLFDGETEDYYVISEAPPPPPPPPPAEFVPEWGSVALLGSGLAGLAGYASLRWRKR